MKQSLRRVVQGLLALAYLSVSSTAVKAQEPDLFDDTVLRQIDITVYDANGVIDPNFWTKLVQNWNGSGANLPADITISGPDIPVPVTRTGVGLRIKGNSSFFFLPSGSQKASFNIEVDDTDPAADLWGYSTINLNNGIEDPTFCREIGFFRFIRRYTPAGLGNHLVVTINGDPWGVYVNIQQYNKRLLEEYYEDGGGVRIKCPNIGGAALRWFGSAISSYFADYDLKNDGGLGTNAAWQTLVDCCDSLNNSPAATPKDIDKGFSVDAAIWTVVGENLFMDEDSYISKGADFNVYWEPIHQRSYLHQHDGNESWGVSLFGWPGGTITELSPTYRFNGGMRPAVRRVVAIPEWRERYFAHYRTMLEDFSWDDFEPQIEGYHTLIDAAVLADPKRIYSYNKFTLNFTTDVNIPLAGTTVVAPGLRRYVDDRLAFLSVHPEIAEPVPAINWLRHAPYRPAAGQPVFITTSVTPDPTAPIGEVTLYYRHQPGHYLEALMLDDGLNGDGAAGDGVYGVELPATLALGDFATYYVGAASDVASGSGTRFLPKYAEGRPQDVRVGFGASGMRITEVLYSGTDGEFFELTNTTAAPVDLAGWSMDDSSANVGTFDLTPAGVISPGESIIITQSDPLAFSAAWNLSGVTVLGLNVNANLGRNDSINIFDAMGELHERLAYGDERYPYSERSKDESNWVCDGGLGQDDPYAWRNSVAADGQNSVVSLGGDTGSPGTHATAACDELTFGDTYCPSNPNTTGLVGALAGVGSPIVGADDFSLLATQLPVGEFGYFIMGQVQAVVNMPGGSQGVLCLANPIARLISTLGSVSPSGELSSPIDLFNVPVGSNIVAVTAGETWSFQCWHRDFFGGSPTSNFTDGIEIAFQ
ncbi:MAG: spore coat protein CotH [Planctomycetota bacterium]|jgi:spore coat protein CotH